MFLYSLFVDDVLVASGNLSAENANVVGIFIVWVYLELDETMNTTEMAQINTSESILLINLWRNHLFVSINNQLFIIFSIVRFHILFLLVHTTQYATNLWISWIECIELDNRVHLCDVSLHWLWDMMQLDSLVIQNNVANQKFGARCICIHG